MTKNFDFFYRELIKEVSTSKSKRREQRYGLNHPNKSSAIRKIRLFNNKSDSQKTKIDGSQQYVGNFWKNDGVRTKNKSEKTANEKGISKGLGGYTRVKGINPKTPGSKVNSKQGDMQIKYVLPNGAVKVGSTGKTQFKNIDMIFHEPN